MLYKVTPMMAPPEAEKPKKRREPGAPRKRRKTAIYDGEGHEVLITLMCLKCKSMKPLAQFGLRKMADGAIRNQPWCRTCRSQAGTKPPKKTDIEVDGTTPPPGAEATLSADPSVSAPLQQDDETTQPMVAQSETVEQIDVVDSSSEQHTEENDAPLAAEPSAPLTQ